MLLKNWMSKDIISVKPEDRIEKAVDLLRKYEIRMLPVLDDGGLVGIVTDRDIKNATVPAYVKQGFQHDGPPDIRVEDIMIKEVITVPPDFTLEETAELLLTHKISGVPVVDDQQTIIGVITQSDVFRALVSTAGIGKKGIQFGFYVKDEPGCIRKLTDAIRSYGGRIASIQATNERCKRGFRRIYIRVYHIDAVWLDRLKEVLREMSKIIYMVDHERKQREIFEDDEG